MKKFNHYKVLADVFRYPDTKFGEHAQKFLDLVADAFPEKISSLRPAMEQQLRLSTSGQQEYYLKTFDVQAVCYLDVGYVMFGEDYKRAQLLVNLQNEHRETGVDCGSELGDHLPNVLTLLATTANKEFAEELGFIILTPAVRFMLLKFKTNNNFYKGLLEILYDFLQQDFEDSTLAEYAFPEEAFSGDKDFLITSPKSVVCDTLCNKRKSF